MSSGRAKLLRGLETRRSADAGYGAAPGAASDTESTALVALALRAAGADSTPAEEWLAARQREDGAWPFRDAVPEPSWSSAWALLALAGRADTEELLVRGVRWLAAREGRRPGLLARALTSLTGPRLIELDLSLRGWPWHAAASSWVEPSALALLALRRLAPRGAADAARERIAEGERLLWDRMCVDGGWNYGNRRVLGETLPPYPDTTALALIALQGAAHRAELDASFAALARLLAARASSLSLALAALAARLHGRDAGALEDALAARIEERGAPVETRALAFALLALSGGAELLRVPAA
jgi:hypothetical protein